MIKIVFFFLLLFFFVGLEKRRSFGDLFCFLSFTFGMRVCGRSFTSLTVTVIDAWLLLLWYGAMFLAHGTKLCHVLGGETGTYYWSVRLRLMTRGNEQYPMLVWIWDGLGDCERSILNKSARPIIN